MDIIDCDGDLNISNYSEGSSGEKEDSFDLNISDIENVSDDDYDCTENDEIVNSSGNNFSGRSKNTAFH